MTVIVSLARRLACLVALGILGGLAMVVLQVGSASLGAALSGPDHGDRLATLLVAAAAVLAALSGLALVAGGLATVLTARPTGASWSTSWSLSVTPIWWRRVLLTACGLGLSAVPAAAAGGATDAGSAVGGPPDLRCPPHCAATLEGLPLPDLPLAREDGQIVVRPGDSLWRIATAHVPSDATAAEVAALVQRIHVTNRRVLGPDPDLIFPGTHLTIPGGTR